MSKLATLGKTEGTGETVGTPANGTAFEGSPEIPREGTREQARADSAAALEAATLDPMNDPVGAQGSPFPDPKDRPCYRVYDDWTGPDGKHPAGVWYHGMKAGKGKDAEPELFDLWLCSPLHVEAVTCTDGGRDFGRLLRYRDTFGRWHNWGMPMELLRGSCEELRGELLAAGVDVPCVRNIAFFKYVRSPISFYQMIGRGTRLDTATGKLMFTVYDYTGATELFGEDFITRPPRDSKGSGGDPPPPEPTVIVDGFDVHITNVGRYVVVQEDGQAKPIPVEEYKSRLASRLIAEAPTLQEFRRRWVEPEERRELIDHLVSAGCAPNVLRILEEMNDYDLYDVLADLGFGLAPRTRGDRALAFTYKHEDWLKGLPPQTAAAIKAIVSQFEKGGIDGLENPQIFQTPEVRAAGGLQALMAGGKPADLLRETKERMFSA